MKKATKTFNQVKKEVVKKPVAKAVYKKELAKMKDKKSSAKKVANKKGPEMISYEMKMVIPTGQYANIQPCIIVKGGSIEEAHDFVAPHMNKLWKEYFMCTERVNQPAPAVKATPVAPKTEKPVEKAPEAPKTAPEETKKPDEQITPPVAPASAVALNKATQAITSCMSREALDLLSAQVEKSVKLGDEDKTALRKLVAEKSKDFDEKYK